MAEEKFGSKQQWANLFVRAVREFYDRPDKEHYITSIKFFLLKAEDRKIEFLAEAIDMFLKGGCGEKEKRALCQLLSRIKQDVLVEEEIA